MQSKVFHNSGTVDGNGVGADTEQRGDFLVGLALRNQLKNFLLPQCQAIIRILGAALPAFHALNYESRNARAHVDSAFDQSGDRASKIDLDSILQDIS